MSVLIASQNPSLDITSRSTAADIEQALSAARRETLGPAARVRLPSSSGSSFFADIWSAILVATVSKVAPRTTVVSWGNRDWPFNVSDAALFHTLAGVAAAKYAFRVAADGKGSVCPFPADEIEWDIAIRRKGTLEERGGTTRTLVELDPQHPVSHTLSESGRFVSDATSRLLLFQRLVLEFRREIEVTNRRANITPQLVGYYKDLALFLNELHENAYWHGVLDQAEQRMPGVRFVRFRKHIVSSKHALIDRAVGFDPLKRHFQDLPMGDQTQAVLEVSVSDFGLGIVGRFLASDFGKYFASKDRRQLLQSLLLEQLSSKGANPAAGLGIFRALRAAKAMRAFVSLRTNEFWMCRSYADPQATLELQDVRPNAQLASISGTHWQFLLPQPIMPHSVRSSRHP